MDPQLKWLVKLAVTAASLLSLIDIGRRRGWL
jgi:hypothetical protein